MGGGVGGGIGGGIGVEGGGREGEGIRDGRVGGEMNQSCNELGSRHLLGRWSLRDTSVAEGITIEGLREGT